MADEEAASNPERGSKLKLLLGTAAAIVIALIAVLIVAEPFKK